MDGDHTRHATDSFDLDLSKKLKTHHWSNSMSDTFFADAFTTQEICPSNDRMSYESTKSQTFTNRTFLKHNSRESLSVTVVFVVWRFVERSEYASTSHTSHLNHVITKEWKMWFWRCLRSHNFSVVDLSILQMYDTWNINKQSNKDVEEKRYWFCVIPILDRNVIWGDVYQGRKIKLVAHPKTKEKRHHHHTCTQTMFWRIVIGVWCTVIYQNLIALEQYDFHCQMILMELLHWHSASTALPDVQPCWMNLFTLLTRLMVFCVDHWMIWESFLSVIWALFSCNSVNPLSVFPHLQKIVPNLVLSTP